MKTCNMLARFIDVSTEGKLTFRPEDDYRTSTTFRKTLRSLATLVLLSQLQRFSRDYIMLLDGSITVGESVGRWILSFHHYILS
jgi:hypothetical protein